MPLSRIQIQCKACACESDVIRILSRVLVSLPQVLRYWIVCSCRLDLLDCLLTLTEIVVVLLGFNVTIN